MAMAPPAKGLSHMANIKSTEHKTLIYINI